MAELQAMQVGGKTRTQTRSSAEDVDVASELADPEAVNSNPHFGSV